MFTLGKTKWPDMEPLQVDGQLIEVAIRVHARAKHYRLTINAGGNPVLTVPTNGRWVEAKNFLERQTAWLAARLKRMPPGVPFVDGAVVPVRGTAHLVVAAEKIRGQVQIVPEQERPVLLVPGGPKHMARRLRDWLKSQAQDDLEVQVGVHATNLGVRPSAIKMRGQSTRWGSCASSGQLNFNWRLILAPPFVLDYVAAHEVAHLVEMNHSRAFWTNVERTLPDMERGRSWLKANGRGLMAYGMDTRGADRGTQ